MARIQDKAPVLRVLEPDAWVTDADPRYRQPVIARLILDLQRHGKKAIAQRIVYESLRLLKKKFPFVKPTDVVAVAVGNMDVRHVAATARTELLVRRLTRSLLRRLSTRGTAADLHLSTRAVILRARNRRGDSMTSRLAQELEFAYVHKLRPIPPQPPNKGIGVVRSQRRG